MARIAESELILNPDGSVYHLNLLPQDIATTIITVGDPERVKMVSSFFDSIEVKKEKREFHTHTGSYKNKLITVISTGIGTDNIDIVFNELDALVNIDLEERLEKSEKTSLKIIRIGTSGCLDENIPVNAKLLSTYGLGMDGLLNYYEYDAEKRENSLLQEIRQNELFSHLGIAPYCFSGSPQLLSHFSDENTYHGITATSAGFYGPQGRRLRLKPKVEQLLDELKKMRWDDQRITNFEMETAGIYGLAKLLGHEALSINLLIANRARGEFSKNPQQKMMELIEWSLQKI